MRDFFYLKNVYNSYIRTILILKLYIYLFFSTANAKIDQRYDHLGSYY